MTKKKKSALVLPRLEKESTPRRPHSFMDLSHPEFRLDCSEMELSRVNNSNIDIEENKDNSFAPITIKESDIKLPHVKKMPSPRLGKNDKKIHKTDT